MDHAEKLVNPAACLTIYLQPLNASVSNFASIGDLCLITITSRAKTIMSIYLIQCLVLLFTSVTAVAKHGEGEVESSAADPLSPTPTVTPSASPTETTSNPTSSSSSFQFDQPNNATTCQSTVFAWHASLSNVIPMTLAVTNERGAPSSLTNNASVPLISRTLTTSAASNASQFNWSSVDVPQGWYIIAAFDTTQTAGISAQSSPFFVQTGPDVDCLSSASMTTSVGAPASPTASAPAESQRGSATGSATHKGLSSGALVGTICAVVIGVIMLVLAFTYPQWWRHALMRYPRSRRPDGPYYLF